MLLVAGTDFDVEIKQLRATMKTIGQVLDLDGMRREIADLGEQVAAPDLWDDQENATRVTGRLSAGKTPFDVLRATFPAGTLSGAPKVRAMQIIEELEPTRRGAYGGAIGYFSFNGNLDACITIRTLLVKDGMAYIQAGGGIVADSDPEAEYEETVNKSNAVRRAIEMAEAGLDG